MEPETVNQDEYNGWVNRETWAAALHLSNDYELYKSICRLFGGLEPDHVARLLERFVKLHVDLVLHPSPDDDDWVEDYGMVFDRPLWRRFISDVGSLWRVDWRAVADLFGRFDDRRSI